MLIDKNKVVLLSYILKVEGQVVDQSSDGSPLGFIFGNGQMIPGFEKNLTGLKKDDSYEFVVAPEEGYGDVNEEAIVEIDKQIFVVEGELIKELQMGASLPMQDQNGNRIEGKVLDIGLEKVKMDFNHPLAGKELSFSGKIDEVREPTTEELEHGHVHGPGGHQH